MLTPILTSRKVDVPGKRLRDGEEKHTYLLILLVEGLTIIRRAPSLFSLPMASFCVMFTDLEIIANVYISEFH